MPPIRDILWGFMVYAALVCSYYCGSSKSSTGGSVPGLSNANASTMASSDYMMWLVVFSKAKPATANLVIHQSSFSTLNSRKGFDCEKSPICCHLLVCDRSDNTECSTCPRNARPSSHSRVNDRRPRSLYAW